MKHLKKRFFALLLALCLLFGLGAEVLAAPAASEAEEILAGLTLEQKLAQMLMPAFTSADAAAKAVKELSLGGLILFADNAQGTASTTGLICDLQTAALASAAQLPLLVSVDQEGGYVTRLGTGTKTSGNMALGATGDPALAREAAQIIGSELSAEGFNVDFAPVLDVNSNPSNPVIGLRSFSDDPEQVAEYGAAFLGGLHDAGVAAALKHFPGHGDTDTDSHTGLPCINKSLRELRKCELIPFRAGIAAGADIVMTAHIQFPQIEQETYVSKLDGKTITLPATLSKTIITDLLRGELGYEGVVCTDAMNMDAIASHFDSLDAARLAINAGADILLIPMFLSDEKSVEQCRSYIASLAALVRGGKIAEETVDAAVARILNLKCKLGLPGLTVDASAQVQKALQTVGSAAHHEQEWAIAEKAITLVKNAGDTLPIAVKENGRVLLFCSYNNEINGMKYAVSRLKAEGTVPQSAEFEVFCYQNHTLADYEKALSAADAVVASVETYRAANLTGGWQAEFLDSLIERTHALGKKIAVISLQLPYDLARYQAADVLLAAYGSMGMDAIPAAFNGETPTYGVNLSAAVCAAFGGFVPTGTLPVDIPRLDVDHNFTSFTLYPRGYGITNPFRDVKESDYFASAVRWAVGEKITSGTGRGTFSPDQTCTRAEVVTFLWRAAGCPAAKSAWSFRDVKRGSYYETAVAWAVAQGITSGMGGGNFGPDAPCTRAQVVSFLARFAGVKDAPAETGFSDVPKSAYCAAAVCWAAEQKITSGTGGGKFSPERPCTRAEVVTFLWRYRGND